MEGIKGAQIHTVVSWMKPCYQDNKYHTQKPLSLSGHLIPQINPEDHDQNLFFSVVILHEEDATTTLKSPEPKSVNEPGDKDYIANFLPFHWQQELSSSGDPGLGPSMWNSPWEGAHGFPSDGRW